MKKLIILLFTLFTFTTIVSADAGNNVRYKSRSSSSSSRSSGSSGSFNFFSSSSGSSSNRRSYSSSSSSGGYLPNSLFGLGGIEVIVLIGVVGYLFYNDRRKKNQTYNPKDFSVEPPVIQEEKKEPPKVFYNPSIVEKVTAIDPLFNENAFLSYAEEVYVKLQHAWTRKDWKEVRQYESESLYHTHSEQLQEYISNKKTNVVERIGVKDSALYDFKVEGNFEKLTVTLSVVLRDYVVDDTTKEILEGDPLEDLYVDYELEFIRNAGQKTRENHVMHALQCPSCGSKNGINELGICDYCGYQRVNDWVLNSIKSI